MAEVAGSTIMPIHIQCANCGKRLTAKDDLAGKNATCPGCGTVIAIPAAHPATQSRLPKQSSTKPSTATQPGAQRAASATYKASGVRSLVGTSTDAHSRRPIYIAVGVASFVGLVLIALVAVLSKSTGTPVPPAPNEETAKKEPEDKKGSTVQPFLNATTSPKQPASDSEKLNVPQAIKAGPWEFQVLGVELLEDYSPDSKTRMTPPPAHKIAAVRMRCKPVRDYTPAELDIVRKSALGKLAMELADVMAKAKERKLVVASSSFLLLCFKREGGMFDCNFIEFEKGQPLTGSINPPDPTAKKQFWGTAIGEEITARAFFAIPEDESDLCMTFMPVFNDSDFGRTIAAEMSLGQNGQLDSVKYGTVAEFVRKHKQCGTAISQEGRHPAAENEISFDLGGAVKLQMVLIPAGEFLMGSPDWLKQDVSRITEHQHRVRITKPFCLGKYEVTQEQWQAIMGNNPSKLKGLKNPVDLVSYDDCQEFFKKLNAGFSKGKGEFTLPTEAQWEYACRAGSTTRYYFGDDEASLGEYAWFSRNSGGKAHPVGEKKPNAFGLYDMQGNVDEWCRDWYSNFYGSSSLDSKLPTSDPTGGTSGPCRVGRGGSWSCPAENCRSAHRYGASGSETRDLGAGFRAALILADTQISKKEPVKEPSSSGAMKSSTQPAPATIAGKAARNEVDSWDIYEISTKGRPALQEQFGGRTLVIKNLVVKRIVSNNPAELECLAYDPKKYKLSFNQASVVDGDLTDTFSRDSDPFMVLISLRLPRELKGVRGCEYQPNSTMILMGKPVQHFFHTAINIRGELDDSVDRPPGGQRLIRFRDCEILPK
jgi:formylglycine-generating enzyme required for sulfatase activity